MSDLDAKIRALEEQVARESAAVEQARAMGAMRGVATQASPAGGPTGFGAPPPVAAAAAAGGEKAPPRFAPDADSRSIFVNNLPKQNETPEELAQFFSECGQVLKCTLLRDKATNALKGSAYIEFASHEAAGRAVDTKANAIFRGQQLVVTKKRSHFNPARARGGVAGRGRGSDAATVAATNAMATMMGAMMGMFMNAGGGGRGRGGRGGDRGGAGGFGGGAAPGGFGAPPPPGGMGGGRGGFRPF